MTDTGLRQCPNGDDCVGSGRKRSDLGRDVCLACARKERGAR